MLSVAHIANASHRILEVECAMAKSAGLELTPASLGLPEGYGELETENMLNHASMRGKTMASRAPMSEIPADPSGGAALSAYEAAMEAAMATRTRNQTGSNIFG